MSLELNKKNVSPNDFDSANTPYEYADQLWSKAGNPDSFHKVFEFQKKTYLAKREGSSKGDLKVEMLANAAIKVQFVQISEAGDHSVTLELDEGPRTWTVHLRARDLLTQGLSDIVSDKTRLWVTRDQRLLTHLYKHLNKGNPPTIRSTGSHGYDQETKWYIFKSFAINPDGKLVFPQSGGDHFLVKDDQYIRGSQHFKSAIKEISDDQLPIELFIKEIYEAYGGRGLISTGFWVASLFSQPVFEAFGFFPFLSMYGEPGAGKSTLATVLNRALSMSDWEGIPLSRTNTAKGPQRQIASQSSVVVTLLEWTQGSKISEEDLLNLYARNPQQIRAASTNDGEYIEVPFNCSLALVQNDQPFTLRQVKERIVSVKFDKEHQTEETTMAARKLLNRNPAMTASIGIQLLQHRKYFEDGVVEQITESIRILEGNGIHHRRICDNHAIPLGGFMVLLEWLKANDRIEEDDLEKWQKASISAITEAAFTKLDDTSTEFSHADDFLQSLDERVAEHPSNGFVVEDRDTLIVHLNRAMDYFVYPHHIRPLLKKELKRHERFLDNRGNSNAIRGKKEKVWKFKPVHD